MKFEGIIPPVITPYRTDGSVDYPAFGELIEHLVSSSDTIIVGGTTGEYFTQSAEERIKLVETAMDIVQGRLPVVAGIGGIRTKDCIDLGLAAKNLGVNGVLVSSPYYATPTQEENAEHALAIDREVGLPIMLYNYPGRTGAVMGTVFLDKLRGHGNFMAIKESSGDIDHLHTLATEYPDLTLLCGTDDQALEYFAWGAKGWVCGAGTALPLEHRALFQACIEENNLAKGRKIMSAMLPYLKFLEQGGKFIQSVKYTCELAGLPAGSIREPLQPLTDKQKEELGGIVETMKSKIANILADEQ